jgi:drug/metabolite transporter (DMT)-like permease
MTRLQADFLLFLAAIIWGTTFIAQKMALDDVGHNTYVAARFLVSLVLILPLAIREFPKVSPLRKAVSNKELFFLCAFFCGGVILQQVGLGETSVTNAGFLTGLYVVFVPVVCKFFYRERLSPWILPAALLSVAGVWMLSGGRLESFSLGDVLILGCAVSFAMQVAMIGRIMQKLPAPFCISVLQFAAVSALALILALVFETPSWAGIFAAFLPVLYAGVLSGAIGYTVQVVAQRYTPASDAGVIMSTEAVFAAVAGAVMLGERLSVMAYTGCAVIGLAVMTVELGPYIAKRLNKKS